MFFNVMKGEDAYRASKSLGEKSFLWATNGEPHMIRRREILAKYGDQVRKLYGADVRTAIQVIAVVFAQFVIARHVRDWSWLAILPLSYVLSGTLNQNLFCAQHEISHCLAFKKPVYNHYLALFANMVLVVPMAVKFRVRSRRRSSRQHDEAHCIPFDFRSTITTTTCFLAWMAVMWICQPFLSRPTCVDCS